MGVPRFAVLLTALTLFVLSVNLWFWWRYLRRTDNQRFWNEYNPLRQMKVMSPPATIDAKEKVEPNEGRKLKGLTSKEHLFLRVLSTVAFIDAAVFYAISRNMRHFISNFSEVVVLTTGLTLFVLTIQLLFWWKYLRRADNQRIWWFWWIPRKTENSN